MHKPTLNRVVVMVGALLALVTWVVGGTWTLPAVPLEIGLVSHGRQGDAPPATAKGPPRKESAVTTGAPGPCPTIADRPRAEAFVVVLCLDLPALAHPLPVDLGCSCFDSA